MLIMTTKQEFNCVFCKDVFENKEDLQEHFRKHGDPKFKNRFEADSQTSEEKPKDKVELVSCDVCSQVFPTISKAITHKHKVHPDHDAKYFCPWCGKLFTLKHLYNIHVQSSHGDQEEAKGKRFRCDSCSVDFYIPSAMINHNKFFHRQDTDLPDIGQSKKVKFYEQEVIPIYYCAFCGEEYENKVNLFKHTSDDHGDENQSPDEVLKCPMCEAVFYHLDAYEIHLTFHSSEDMYSVKNPEFSDLLDYSLETVPPIIEKVENLVTEDQNQDTDAESTMNAVGIEKFLELAMDQSDSSPVKVKKHKKHKKSKKSAITLDEFLSMNQDVFGEGLDFQGIEEVPTRVVKKQLKNNKKNTVVTSAELDKLKKAGIVVKRKVSRNPILKSFQVATPVRTNMATNKPVYKLNKVREIETSSEVLTKLINQSNNQIKIVKKINSNSVSNEPPQKEDFPSEEAETVLSNRNDNPNKCNIEEIKNTSIPESGGDTKRDLSCPTPEKSPVAAPIDTSSSNKLSVSNINSDVLKEKIHSCANANESMQKPAEIDDSQHNSSKPVNYKTSEETISPDNSEHENIDNESDQFNSDTEFEHRKNKTEPENCVHNEKPIDSNRASNENSNHDSVSNTPANSLSSLKHLSHLITVKPVSQNKNNILPETIKNKITEANSQLSQNINTKETSTTNACDINLSKSKTIVEKDPTLDALKTLSKNITIKSLTTKRNINEREPEDDEVEEEKVTSNIRLHDVSGNKNITIKKTKVEKSDSEQKCKILNSLSNQERKGTSGKQLIAQPLTGKIPNKLGVDKAENANNILKRLTNITTKPIMNKNNSLSSVVKPPNMTEKIVETKEKKEEIIEIFDIDDSEDEDEKNREQPQPSQNLDKSMDAIKNLSKNITIKSLNQQSTQRNIKIENNIKIEKEEDNSQNKIKNESNINSLINIQNKSMAFKNVLQGLCKNITIKSRNNSPSHSLKSHEYNSQDTQVDNDIKAGDSDSCPENFKITEIDEDMELDGDNEDHSDKTEMSNTNIDQPLVESPKEYCSENEDEDVHDFEANIKVSTVQKSKQSMNSTINSVCLNNLKNTNKNITIKSLSKNLTDRDDNTKLSHVNESQETTHTLKKQFPTKTSNQVIKEIQGDNMTINKISKNIDNNKALPWNKNISAMNQVNTVNKEVTVKTVQTKTVIQEITTTVTKTIKTVNQTMKQEVLNTVQTSSPMVAQRIQGMRPTQSKNLQGVVIRHATPVSGPRPSNTISQIRPAGTMVRPSKQIVPIRPSMPIAKPNNNPRMVVGKKIAPSPSPNKQTIGRSLKISPSAMVAKTNVKRPNTEDVSGPFSCFKKPKESLIPVSDIPTFNSSGSESTAYFTSASHTSSSNFTSTTKVVKGNSVVTAKQMKSEVNATSQQLSRLSNTTGLKIMTSQHKQSQVQENNESSAMKRTTLEAIQKLQMQGLLVKKPRVNERIEDSDHEGDNNVGYSSADEHDE